MAWALRQGIVRTREMPCIMPEYISRKMKFLVAQSRHIRVSTRKRRSNYVNWQALNLHDFHYIEDANTSPNKWLSHVIRVRAQYSNPFIWCVTGNFTPHNNNSVFPFQIDNHILISAGSTQFESSKAESLQIIPEPLKAEDNTSIPLSNFQRWNFTEWTVESSEHPKHKGPITLLHNHQRLNGTRL